MRRGIRLLPVRHRGSDRVPPPVLLGDDEFLKQLASFAVLGVGFPAPLGGIIWGHFGDWLGRKKAFLGALVTMAVASVLIDVLPNGVAPC